MTGVEGLAERRLVPGDMVTWYALYQHSGIGFVVAVERTSVTVLWSPAFAGRRLTTYETPVLQRVATHILKPV